MFYRRVAKNLKDQNWTAVLVDFLIVVLGVFLGIQLGNWNEYRQDLRTEQVIIERLTADFKNHETVLLQRLERSADLTQKTGHLVNLIRDDAYPNDEAMVKDLIYASLSLSPKAPPPGSYTELLTSGDLSNIRNLDLREKLLEYGQWNALWDSIPNATIEPQKNPDSLLRLAFKGSTDHNTWGNPEEAIISYDWEKLKQAELTISVIQHHQWEQLTRHYWDILAVQEILKVLEVEPTPIPQ